MLDKFKSTAQNISGIIKEQASILSDSAKERGYKLIEDWIRVLPEFERLGFEVTSFAIGISISPILEVELKGRHEDFPLDRINQILEKNSTSSALSLVFNTIKTTYNLHLGAKCQLKDPLIVKIKVKIPPEIKVFLGEPIIIWFATANAPNLAAQYPSPPKSDEKDQDHQNQ